MPTGDIQITIADSGAGSIIVPLSNVQVVIGCTSSGTIGQVVATRSPATLQTTFGYGPGVEAAALACVAGGTVLFVKATSTTAGTSTAVVFTGTGSSVITVTGAPFDTYYVWYKAITGGTIAAAGIVFQLSLDGGRTFSPNISLGTANTYAIPNTGMSLAFGAGTVVAGDIAKFSTTEPLWNTAGLLVAINALLASQYAVAGWGSMHIVGKAAGADATTIDGYLATLATGYVYTRCILSARDSIAPVAFGGAGETDATWSAAVTLDYAAVSAKRICACAGHYNQPSPFPNTVVGAPRYRRPLSYALAAREVQIPPQRHAGRVKDGALANIVVDPTNDPLDGFNYHDERINPAFDAARFTSARTRIGLTQAYYIVNPNLMSPVGSDFSILPFGNVMDVACTIVHTVGQTFLNDDVRLNANGTIYENDARGIEATINGAIAASMTSLKMISSSTVVVDRLYNIQLNKAIVYTVTILARGYILQENVTIGFSNPLRAGG